MDSTIWAAIITAAAVIISAIIGLLKERTRNRIRSGQFEKSQALRLGFAIAGLDYLLRMRKKGVELENRPQFVDNEIERCCIIATSIGIELPRDADKLLNEIHLKTRYFQKVWKFLRAGRK